MKMQMSDAEYGRYVEELSPKSKSLKNCFHAFWIGGTICLLGQGLMALFESMQLEKTTAGTLVSISLIALSAILTGLAVYDDIAKVAGAGTLVPITGFANSVVAPAVEFKTEGVILGTCAKMFTIAGPVIVYGVTASIVYGVIYWLSTLL
ncbi:MAG: stage V sporulation protein AC [Ruminococcaceae bacterium]|nr:stage V sporulation protein AC [Oscillospiraceae bacterium]